MQTNSFWETCVRVQASVARQLTTCLALCSLSKTIPDSALQKTELWRYFTTNKPSVLGGRRGSSYQQMTLKGK